jgi:hypothetical protein
MADWSRLVPGGNRRSSVDFQANSQEVGDPAVLDLRARRGLITALAVDKAIRAK